MPTASRVLCTFRTPDQVGCASYPQLRNLKLVVQSSPRRVALDFPSSEKLLKLPYRTRIVFSSRSSLFIRQGCVARILSDGAEALTEVGVLPLNIVLIHF